MAILASKSYLASKWATFAVVKLPKDPSAYDVVEGAVAEVGGGTGTKL